MDVNGAGLKTGHVSISAWFRVDGFSKDWQALVAKGEGSAFRVARRGAEQGIAYAGGSGEGPGLSPNVSDGAFHHMVAITEHQVSTRLWVDGVLVSTGGAPTIVNNGNGNARNPVNPPLYIGDNPQTGNRTWNGPIDDVAIWNRPLTDIEVATLWNNGTGNSLGALLDPSTAPVDGDVNGDRVVNNADFDIIRNHFLLSATTREEGDLNRDGFVEFADFRIWKNNVPAGFGSVADIPEPGTLILVECALLSCICCLSRRYRARVVEPSKPTSI
jgi:concanavalin A-like lectin/glucanase superfamily protein/dockerin type I repeat protein